MRAKTRSGKPFRRQDADDFAARLAIVLMAFEARGLDVTPTIPERFEAQGAATSAHILMRIFHDEICHVAVGERWFRCCCEAVCVDAAYTWKRLISTRFPRLVKPRSTLRRAKRPV